MNDRTSIHDSHLYSRDTVSESEADVSEANSVTLATKYLIGKMEIKLQACN